MQIKNKQITKIAKKNTFSNNELINLFKITLIVCAVLLVFYFITVLVQKNDNSVSEEDTTATIQYDKIIVGQILNRPEDEYLVLVAGKDDNYIDLYQMYLAAYSGKQDALRYYTVDLSDIFNGNHLGDTNILEGNVESFKFSTTVLLKVNNGIIIEAYEDKDSITNYLKELTK